MSAQILSSLFSFINNLNLKQKHYNRNDKQEEYSYPIREEAEDDGFNQLGIREGIEKAEELDIYHEMGTNSKNKTDPSGNDKLVKAAADGNGSYELVYDENHNLVTDPVNMGTYNYCDVNNSVIGHVILDVIPYYIWGNSPSDPTTMVERITGTYKGDVNTTKEERVNEILREARIW